MATKSRFEEKSRDAMRRLGNVALYSGVLVLGTLWLCTKKRAKREITHA